MRRVHRCQPNEKHGRVWAMRHYVGARLHRKLFMAMGLAIFATVVSSVVIFHLATERSWRTERLTMVQDFFSSRFADAWEKPEARDRLASDAARAFQVGVVLYAVDGRKLSSFGEVCQGHRWSFPVKRSALELGKVEVCPGSHFRMEKKLFFFGLGVAGLVLWIFAGLLAHRIGAPLVRLAEVTAEIGDGKLSSRARLGRQHSGEVGLLATAIDDMAERIERQMKGQRELLAGVSHEIRTPLSRLRVLTEILRDKNVDEKALANIEREIADINDLTSQLLASSRLEFETLDEVSLDAVELARTSLSRASLSEDLLKFEGEPRMILGDPTLLGRALSNIIENAKHHGGALTELRVVFLERQVTFTAIDQGPGFKPEDLPRVFDSFFRGTGSGKGSSSLGLGLALVRRISQAHDGHAHATNAQNGGAEVSFTVAHDTEKALSEVRQA